MPAPSTPSSTPPTLPLRLLPLLMPEDQMILISMALVYWLSLPLAFAYFLDITLFILKKPPMMKNKINHQNDVKCVKKTYNKWLDLIGKKILKILSKTDLS